MDQLDQDDRTVGRVLGRREVLQLLPGLILLGPAGELLAQGGTTAVLPGCVVVPEQTEGPYFVDGQLDRSDVRSEPQDGAVKQGAALALAFRVTQIAGGACTPLPGATVDIWQCDAMGVYSGASDAGFNTVGQKFLRGYQVTDTSGAARFTTIYPGWYSGRAVHIHFKIRTAGTADGRYEFTSQLYFDEALTDRVHATPPYNTKGRRNTLNSTDGIFRNGGTQLVLNVAPAARGYQSTFDIGLDLSNAQAGAPDGGGMGRGRGGPRGTGGGRRGGPPPPGGRG